jgi:hypothetical protein
MEVSNNGVERPMLKSILKKGRKRGKKKIPTTGTRVRFSDKYLVVDEKNQLIVNNFLFPEEDFSDFSYVGEQKGKTGAQKAKKIVKYSQKTISKTLLIVDQERRRKKKLQKLIKLHQIDAAAERRKRLIKINSKLGYSHHKPHIIKTNYYQLMSDKEHLVYFMTQENGEKQHLWLEKLGFNIYCLYENHQDKSVITDAKYFLQILRYVEVEPTDEDHRMVLNETSIDEISQIEATHPHFICFEFVYLTVTQVVSSLYNGRRDFSQKKYYKNIKIVTGYFLFDDLTSKERWMVILFPSLEHHVVQASSQNNTMLDLDFEEEEVSHFHPLDSSTGFATLELDSHEFLDHPLDQLTDSKIQLDSEQIKEEIELANDALGIPNDDDDHIKSDEEVELEDHEALHDMILIYRTLKNSNTFAEEETELNDSNTSNLDDCDEFHDINSSLESSVNSSINNSANNDNSFSSTTDSNNNNDDSVILITELVDGLNNDDLSPRKTHSPSKKRKKKKKKKTTADDSKIEKKKKRKKSALSSSK